MICPLCNGQRERLVKYIHPYTKRVVSRTEPCLCFLSDLVSNDCRLLEPWRQAWLLPENQDQNLVFNPADLASCPSYIIKGSYSALALNVKALMMKYRFTEPKPLISFSQAIDVLHDFYVEQKDGTSPQLSDTNRFSLMVICLGTEEANKALKTVIAQIAYTRQRDRKPTWFYLPSNRQALSQCTQEHSPELDSYTAGYKALTIALAKGQTDPSVSAQKDDAANFGGLR